MTRTALILSLCGVCCLRPAHSAPVPPAAKPSPESRFVGCWHYSYGSMTDGWIEFHPPNEHGVGAYHAAHRVCADADYCGIWWVDRTGAVNIVERRIADGYRPSDCTTRYTFTVSPVAGGWSGTATLAHLLHTPGVPVSLTRPNSRSK